MPYDASGQYVAEHSSDQPSSTQFDQGGQYVPLDLLGSRGRIQAQTDATNAARNQGYWNNIQAPTQQQLMGSQQGQDAQHAALSQMQQWGQGGLTGADRSMMEATRGRDAQAAGAQQRSMMQQATARGVGGSGLDYATQMGAQQQGQQQASDAESQMMGHAQQRALQATQQQGQLGGQMRQQDQSAYQGAFQNQATRAGGATGQYGADQAARQSSRDRQQQSDTAAVGLLAML